MGRDQAGACYRELGAELRKRREKAGLSSAAVAEATGWNRSRVSRIESGHIGFGVVDVIHYLAVCGVRIPTVQDLLRLCEDAERQLGYWLSPPAEQIGAKLSSLIYHESTAVRSVSYEPLLVPGLLQTPEYARLRFARPATTPEEVESLVRVRMERKAVLHRRNSARFTFFVHEQALRLRVGSVAIMHDQLLHIVLMAALDQVTVRVVPTDAGEKTLFGGSFRLMEFRDDGPLVYLDHLRGGFFIEDRDYVNDYRQLLPDLSAVALDEGQSRKFMADLADEYDRGSRKRHADIYQLEEEHL
jgi:transcriptional regulator with XRE-family HTH domain